MGLAAGSTVGGAAGAPVARTVSEGFYALAITADTVIAGGQQKRTGHWFLQQGAAWFTGRP